MKRERLLSELDYLLTEEAADYCRVSPSHFKEQAPALGIRPVRLMGKVTYRKVDLKSLMERAWQASTAENWQMGNMQKSGT